MKYLLEQGYDRIQLKQVQECQTEIPVFDSMLWLQANSNHNSGLMKEILESHSCDVWWVHWLTLSNVMKLTPYTYYELP